jgi:hypothetical protein
MTQLPEPAAYDNAYLTVPQAGKVEDALHVMSTDATIMSRLALASTLGHGEGVWVFEIAYQLARRGLRPRQEHALGGVKRIDLVVGEEAFEVKSSFVRFAAKNSVAETEKWFLPDAAKLRRGSARGHQLITVATMLGATHVRFDLDVPMDSTDAWRIERDAGLAAYRSYASTVAVGPLTEIDLGVGAVPAHGGHVQFDALLFCVHEGDDPRPAAEQDPVVSDGAA